MACNTNNPFDFLIKKSRQYPYNTLIAIVSIIAGYTILLFMDYSFNHEYKTVCPFKLITGIPCPGCGMGRASIALIHGNITHSLYYNILCIPFTLSVIAAFIWLIKDLLTGHESFFRFIRQPVRKKYLILLFLIIILTWVLNIYHHI